jgi:hypothetical protein
MKKILLLVLLFSSILFASVDIDNDFRNTHWGMSRDEVKKIEKTSSLNKFGGTFYYVGEIFNFKSIIIYVFNKNNKLKKGTYIIKQPHTVKDDYIIDYYYILKKLKKKYGTPANENIFKNKKLLKAETQGMAISLGKLSYQTFWDLKSTIILLKLNGNKGNINLSISYVAKQ